MYFNFSNFRGRTSARGTSLGPKPGTSVGWGDWQNFSPNGGNPPRKKNLHINDMILFHDCSLFIKNNPYAKLGHKIILFSLKSDIIFFNNNIWFSQSLNYCKSGHFHAWKCSLFATESGKCSLFATDFEFLLTKKFMTQNGQLISMHCFLMLRKVWKLDGCG